MGPLSKDFARHEPDEVASEKGNHASLHFPLVARVCANSFYRVTLWQ